ncbi:MAG: hypothetical protein K0A90_07115, partial [Methanosarcinaceae archaeon]|nr:hypothetical protein [Methanosarcinaceae archaeon]
MTLEININDLDAKKKRYVFLVLFTEHPDMLAEKILEIYKSRDLVEEGFRALKSNLEINPTY